MKLLATALIILLTAAQANAQQSATIQGDYAEVRSGEVYTCGCLYSGEMVTAGKEAILVWRIARGDYRGTPVAGIKVAAVLVGKTNLGTQGVPRQSVLYLDGVTSEAQQQAILALWRHAYASVLGEIKSVHNAPISFELQGETVSVRIPGVAQLDVRKAQLPADAHPGSFLWYGPFTALRDSFLATSLHYEYSGVDFQHQWTDLLPSIRGYVGRFTLSSRS